MACPARSLRSTSGSCWRRSKALLGLWGPPCTGTRVSPTTGCPLPGWDGDREAGDGSRVGAQRSLQYERSQWCRKSPWVLAQGFGTLQVTRGRCLVPPSPQHPWSHRTMGTARTPSPDLGDLGASIGTASGKREATGAASPCHKCHHLEGAGGAGCGPRCLPRVDLCAFGRVQRCCRARVQGNGGGFSWGRGDSMAPTVQDRAGQGLRTQEGGTGGRAHAPAGQVPPGPGRDTRGVP